jgi:hypothetical protein
VAGRIEASFTLDQRLITDGRRAYRIEKEVVSAPGRSCEGSGPTTSFDRDSPNTAELPVLVDVLSGARTRIVEPPADLGASADFQLNAEPYAQVGPWLFVQMFSYSYDCGAHGGSGADLVVWDLARGVPSTAFDSASMKEFGAPALARAVRALNTKLGADGPVEAAGVSPSTLLPSYDASGRLRLGVLFSAFACYACGDGRWGSYSISEVVPLLEVPARFAPHAAPPALAALASLVPGFGAGGYGELPDDAALHAALGKLGARPLP